MLALPNLDRASDENHVVNASTLATGTPTNIGFIGFDVFSKLAANPILVGTHHAGPQFMKDLERGFIA